jgi:Cytosolic domain of 10TM putative phosphate transporter
MRSIITRAFFCNIVHRDLSHGDVNSKELRQTEQAVEEYRAKVNTHIPENYGFVSFATVPCAHAVAQVLERKRPGGTKFILTPNPKDIVRRITTAFCVPWSWLPCVDMGKLGQVLSRVDEEEDDGVVPSHHRHNH